MLEGAESENAAGCEVKVIVCCVALNAHYPRLAARLIERFHAVSPGYEIQAWVNCYPPGAPGPVVVDGYDYGGYAAKPFALEYARQSGADVAILLDAAFFPIRPIQPMVEHIQRNGYYLCRNGFKLGEWSSDKIVDAFGLTRNAAFKIDEISSYCVGLDLQRPDNVKMLGWWCSMAATSDLFPGPHTATGQPGRNPGFVSTDPRVKGHRHDQSALSLICNRLGMNRLSDRPHLTAYHLGYGGALPNESTVLVNHGVVEGWTENKDLL